MILYDKFLFICLVLHCRRKYVVNKAYVLQVPLRRFNG